MITPTVRGTAAEPGPLDRRAWHRRAARPVIFWMAALVVLAGVHRWVPQSRWLLVHMFTLGLVTNSILVWGQHFTEALLHSRLPESARSRQVARVWVLNTGIVVTCTGMVADWPWVTVGGAVMVGLALTWYSLSLLAQMRTALPSRFRGTVQYYAAAAALLPVGAGFGAVLAFSPAEPWHGRFLLAHQGLNLLGFVGLTVVGTWVTFWPTVLRTKMVPGQDRYGRWSLRLMVAGLSLVVLGALVGLPLLAGAGVIVYLAGLVVIAVPSVRCALVKPPRDFPAYSMGAGLIWLAGTLVALSFKLLSAGTSALPAVKLQDLTVGFVVGFLAQVLFGAMSYLLPTVMGGGPAAVRVACDRMNSLGALRVAAVNAGLVAYLLSIDSWTRVLTSGIVFLALAGLAPLLVSMIRASGRARAVAAESAPAAPRAAANEPATPRAARGGAASTGAVVTPRRDFMQAVVGLGTVLAAVGAARAIAGPVAVAQTAGSVTPTGQTTTVHVEAHGMRFVPDHVDVPAGNRLVIDLTNTDPTTVHDLYLATGATSGRLSPGQSDQVDVGIVGSDIDGWCTIVGHRSMGMVFTVKAIGGSGPSAAPTVATAAALHIDLTKPPGPGFVTRDAALPPIPAPGRHGLDLIVTEVAQEFAPGYTQRAMTYNGRVMGPIVVANRGDTIATHLVNNGSMGHSVDFHAGTVSPDLPMRTIAPGESLDYPFRVERHGVWLYHCATMPMTAHVASGMFGALIAPPAGLARADRQYVLVQSEAYLGPEGGDVDMTKVAAETPDLVLWNGHANQYVFDPLTAKVGERVRIWVLVAGPSRGTAFHVVGTQFDTVYKEGAFLLRPETSDGGGSQTLDLAPSQGGFVEMVFTEPGTYTFVSHAFVDAERGARGFIKVT